MADRSRRVRRGGDRRRRRRALGPHENGLGSRAGPQRRGQRSRKSGARPRVYRQSVWRNAEQHHAAERGDHRQRGRAVRLRRLDHHELLDLRSLPQTHPARARGVRASVRRARQGAERRVELAARPSLAGRHVEGEAAAVHGSAVGQLDSHDRRADRERPPPHARALGAGAEPEPRRRRQRHARRVERQFPSVRRARPNRFAPANRDRLDHGKDSAASPQPARAAVERGRSGVAGDERLFPPSARGKIPRLARHVRLQRRLDLVGERDDELSARHESVRQRQLRVRLRQHDAHAARRPRRLRRRAMGVHGAAARRARKTRLRAAVAGAG